MAGGGGKALSIGDSTALNVPWEPRAAGASQMFSILPGDAKAFKQAGESKGRAPCALPSSLPTLQRALEFLNPSSLGLGRLVSKDGRSCTSVPGLCQRGLHSVHEPQACALRLVLVSVRPQKYHHPFAVDPVATYGNM